MSTYIGYLRWIFLKTFYDEGGEQDEEDDKRGKKERKEMGNKNNEEETLKHRGKP